MTDHKDNPQDIAAVTESAAYSQCIAELTDWLGTAKIALQVVTYLDQRSCFVRISELLLSVKRYR